MPPTRHHPVAVSAEALAHQWARQAAAPAGAAVVVDAEIAARRRGGSEWRVGDAVAVSVLARPPGLAPSSADLAWAAAGLGAADALDSTLGGDHRCWWPDRVELEPAIGLDVAVGAAVALGPGRVDYAILTVRLGPVAAVGDRADVAASLVDHFRAAADRLRNATTVLAEYQRRCATLDRAVAVSRLPSGSTRGTARAIDESFALVVESPTGLRETIPVAELHSIDLLPA